VKGGPPIPPQGNEVSATGDIVHCAHCLLSRPRATHVQGVPCASCGCPNVNPGAPGPRASVLEGEILWRSGEVRFRLQAGPLELPRDVYVPWGPLMAAAGELLRNFGPNLPRAIPGGGAWSDPRGGPASSGYERGRA
jgi:hypothetical protein